jgi:hypothetical protein
MSFDTHGVLKYIYLLYGDTSSRGFLEGCIYWSKSQLPLGPLNLKKGPNPHLFCYYMVILPSWKATWIDFNFNCLQRLSIPKGVQKEGQFWCSWYFQVYIITIWWHLPWMVVWIDMRLSCPKGLSVPRGIQKKGQFWCSRCFQVYTIIIW